MCLSPQMESPLLELWECLSCPGLIAGTDPHSYCFECLRLYHAADRIKKPLPCVKWWALHLMSQRQRWDCFHCSHVELNVRKAAADNNDINTLNCISPPPFITPTVIEIFLAGSLLCVPGCLFLDGMGKTQEYKMGKAILPLISHNLSLIW